MTDKEREHQRKRRQVEADLEILEKIYFVAMLKDILRKQSGKP